ncbi:MAG: hypothetical protein J5791_00565 [Fibrobacter sp.]|nr:hypothetical protein [Fibrobacter sp.]
MRLRISCLILALVACIAALYGCSRESSIVENPRLRDNHSIVFAFAHPFDNAEAFADSIRHADMPADSIADTITVTVNDSVYFMGFLPLYAEKIYRFEWIFGDTVITSENTRVQSWSFDSAGVYFPIFRAVDGNNAIDTAGVHRRPLYIRVIDTPPLLDVPRDTVRARHKKPATFNVRAIDTCGTIEKFKVDLDAKGKDTAKVWKAERIEGTDSLTITIPYVKDDVDSLGDQTIFVIAIDDDGNETLDTVYLHFNQPPTIEMLQPVDNASLSSKKRQALYYRAEDKDNPGSLRYFIRMAKSPDGRNPPIFTDPEESLIAANIVEKSFEIIEITPDSLVRNKVNLAGIIYWDVWVTDGYDTVYAKHIKDGDKERPWKFYLGETSESSNLEDIDGNLWGYAKYQGWTGRHSTIRITAQDTLGNKFYTHTNDKGMYDINLKPGIYSILATDTSGYRFADTLLKKRQVFPDDTLFLDTMVLRDTSRPIITFDPIDTLNVRDFQFNFKLYDFGSQVASATAWLDGKEVESSYFSTNSWSRNETGITDGEHTFKLVVKDSAGLVSDTAKIKFYVDASSITLSIDGKTSKMVNSTQSITFTAKVENAVPMPDSLTFTASVGSKTFKAKVTDSVATIIIDKDSLPTDIETGIFYTMQAKSKDGIASNTVRFGFYSDGPAVYFETPANDTIISKNDLIAFEVFAYANNITPGDEAYTLTWTCVGEDNCIANNTTSGDYSWASTGEKKLIVTITNNDSKVARDTLRVNVIADPPTIRVRQNSNDDRHKINSYAEVTVSASDKFGTITKVDWGCSNGTMFTFDEEKLIDPPTKSITDVPVSLHMSGTATNNYRCIVRVTDDDGETASDTLSFRVLLDLPFISINKKNLTLTIKDQTRIDFIAVDTLGHLVGYDIACDSIKANLNNWTSISASAPTVTMPPEACTWYCAIQVTDDDNNTARDTATFTVLQDPPTVEVLGNYTVTIKDTIRLDAIANDRYGEIALYEWGCGSAGTANIGFTYSSTTSPSYSAVMPATAQDDYRCIIRVTDDDGNTARDTTFIDIIQAPPTVIVANESAIVREGYNIVLNATAYDYPDYPGEIVKREWSCGAPSDIANRWKTVSQFDTVWKAPAAVATFYCIARVTDDDGNTATDTMNIIFSTETPIINVKDEEIYISAGEQFELNASVNDVWQGISWFTWECFDAKKDTSLESHVTRYDYYANGSSFYDYREGSFTMDGRDIYCVVTAEESSTKAEFRDTTQIHIIKVSPVGVITAADTVYPWSGDESFDSGEPYYFYTSEWGGQNSTLGTIGNASMQDFWWNFSNVDGNYYQGNHDGSLDTSTLEFNSAFIRSTRENSMTICLDYRDSSAEYVTQAFYARHRAEEVCRKVYFRKAWRNQAQDTVIEYSKMTTPPVLETIGNKPVIAYLKNATTVATKYLVDTTWNDLSTSAITATDSITQLRIKAGGSDLYLAVLTSAGKLTVYKSASGTSPWANMGGAIEGVSSVSLDCHPTSGNPLVSYIMADTKASVFSRWNGSAWVTANVSVPTYQTYDTSNCHQTTSKPRKTVCDTTYTNHPIKMRELQPAYLQNGSLAFVFVDTTSAYQSYYTLYDSEYSVKKNSEKISTNVNGVNLAVSGNTLYMGFLNRDTEHYGPYVYKGSVGTNSITWDKSGVYGASIHEGLLAYHIYIKAYDGKLYAIVDDKGKPSLAQSHVFKLDGNTWKLMGENELPYFKTVFYNSKGYYLRGSVPNIAIAGNGKVYISMLAWENAGGRGANFGPIVMKYVADTWTVH